MQRLPVIVGERVRGRKAVEEIANDGGGDLRASVIERQMSVESATPSTYSMTMSTLASAATMSSVGTTFGCRMRGERGLVEKHRAKVGVELVTIDP